MQITKEMLVAKKEELERQRDELLGQANACNGALENIGYWLSVLEIVDGSMKLVADKDNVVRLNSSSAKLPTV